MACKVVKRSWAIDYRPATGQMYGLGSTGRLYVIDPETGTSRLIGEGPITPSVEGTLTGFDFNPTVDRLRIVTNTGQNLRVNPENATAIVDGAINGVANASVTSVAYRNNVAGSATTTLYDIDISTEKLYKQNPANSGTLVEVGSLGLKISGEGGFDISAKEGLALALYTVNDKPTLFTIDTTNARTVTLAKYDKSKSYTGLAIPTSPVAYAVNATNSLVVFDPTSPAVTVAKPIMGLSTGENILGLDFRPSNGQLYALGSASNIYTINTATAAATLAATLSIPLSGDAFGFDFNPVVDRIRITSNMGQNLRFNPADGTVLMDGNLNYATATSVIPQGTAAAYENNFAGTTATALYIIDTRTDALFKQDPPNNGTLVKIGNLGFNVFKSNGFDIGGTSNLAYGILTSDDGSSRLYAVDKSTGAATSKGDFISQVKGFTLGLGF
ncbi:MAG: DUF4394 domain-containing protein [Ginsengibacter sp.]